MDRPERYDFDFDPIRIVLADRGVYVAAALSVADRKDGATEAQLNALFGWAYGSRDSATYTRTANRAKMAREAKRNPAPDARVRDAG